jgi:ApbE superfamily uncharacterized protein (UPF0280 family)
VNSDGLVSFQARLQETDLHILAEKDLHFEALDFIIQYRNQLENYIARNPKFLKALFPLAYDPLAPSLIKEMLKAALAAGVGPMAAVAGGVAQYVGQDLLRGYSREIMVENGGDVFLQRSVDCRVAIFAGESPLSNKIGLVVKKADMPTGICTSSATVGHSLSFGQADAVTVVASSVFLADAAATRLGNETRENRPIGEVLEVASQIEGLRGVVVVRGEELGAWGEVELVAIG